MNKLFLFCAMLLATGTSIHAQSGLQKKVLLTLQPGEVPFFYESNLGLSCGPGGLCVLVKGSDGKFYVYQNGVKQGPYANAAEGMKICYKEPDQLSGYPNITSYETMEESSAVQVVNGETFIRFNGKSYGPYLLVTAISLSPDKKHFMAVARNMTNAVLISDLMPEQTPPGEFKSFHWSPDSQTGFGSFLSGFDINAAMNVNMDGMTDEQRMQFVMDLQSKMEQTKEELFVWFTNGQKFGPFEKGNESNLNPCYSKTALGHWMMIIDHNLYIDGVVAHQFSSDEWVNTEDIWLSADAKQFAVKYYDKIWFSDGTQYPYPILLNRCSTNGHLLEWLCFENENTIVYYSRTW